MKNKINFSMIVITSIVCLLPLFFGLLVYNNLPDTVGIPVSGLDSNGNYNWNFHKSYFVFGMPLIFMILNIGIKIFTHVNQKLKEEAKVLLVILDWIAPAVSLVFVPLWLFRAMGADIPIEMMLYIYSGLVIIIMGNYIPKSKMDKSSIFGIKIKWGSGISDKNWIRGRRLTGFFWMITGFVYIGITFLFRAGFTTSVLRLLVMLFILYTIPILYAYIVFLSGKNKTVKAG